MENLPSTFWDSDASYGNTTRIVDSEQNKDFTQLLIFIAQTIISSVGIIANGTVAIVFLNHKKFRQKIPNMFIINQVDLFLYPSFKKTQQEVLCAYSHLCQLNLTH